MAEYTVQIMWTRDGAAFIDNRYSRLHRWVFDGGIEVPASSSPHVVPVPLSSASAVDPEEAFVAALSSCHLLWFLWVAARRGFVVDSYLDEAIGTLGRNADGAQAMTQVVLRPRIVYEGKRPTPAESQAMHEESHRRCYIANSVKTDVKCEPLED